MVNPLAENVVMQDMLDTWGKKFAEPKKLHAKTKVPCGFFSATLTSEAGVSKTVRTHRYKRIGQGDFAGQPEQTGLWEGFSDVEEQFMTEFLGETIQELRGARQFIFTAYRQSDLVNSKMKHLKCSDVKSLIESLGKKEVMKKYPQSARNEARGDLLRALMHELTIGERTITAQLLRHYQLYPVAMKTYNKNTGEMSGRVRAMIRELLGDSELKVKAQVLGVKEELKLLGLEILAEGY